MRKTRGAERRDWDSLENWETKPPKGVAERRRKAERRKPEVSEGSIEEFETLALSMKGKIREINEPEPTGLDLLIGRNF